MRGVTNFKAYIESNVYTVKFDANASSDFSGKMKDQNMVYGEPQNLYDNKFKRNDADFAGWNTKKDGSGTSYKDGQRVKNLTTKDGGIVTLYAQWKLPYALLSKMTAKGKRSLVLSWNKIDDVDGYDMFFSRCNNSGKDTTCKKVKTIKGNKTFKWTKLGLKKGKAYKAYVKAWVMKNGKKSYVKTSPTVHAYTSGGNKKYTNAKSVTVRNKIVSLKKGKAYKIKASVNKLDKSKKLMPSWHAHKLRYISSNKKVVTVSKTGKITVKGKGKCKVYVLAVNGARKTINVTVR